jgi:hypothetical protein
MRHQEPQPAARTLPALVLSHGRRVICALIGANGPVCICSRSDPKCLTGCLLDFPNPMPKCIISKIAVLQSVSGTITGIIAAAGLSIMPEKLRTHPDS